MNIQMTNSNEKISQSGVIDIGISDHQMIFCTETIIRTRTGEQKLINFRSFKNYSAEDFEKLILEVNFPSYETFGNIDVAYSDFMTRISKIIENIAPTRQK